MLGWADTSNFFKLPNAIKVSHLKGLTNVDSFH